MAWAAKILEVDGFDKATTIAIADDNSEINAVWVYSKYDGHQCELNLAAIKPVWCTRASMRIALLYPFQQLNCQRLNAVIRKDNIKAHRLTLAFGGIKEGELRGYSKDGTNAIVYGMLRQDCRFLKK